MRNQKTVIIMVKAPRAGRVKTRLGRDIGMVNAAWWYRHHLRRLIRRLKDPRWRIMLAVTPDNERRVWPSGVPCIPQGRGDLGARMVRALSGANWPVCLIGSDVPGITPQRIAEVFALLGQHDIVFGPSPDGGFWSVAVNGKMPGGLFRDVRWSTEHALADSCRGLDRIGFAARLADVDTGRDLR